MKRIFYYISLIALGAFAAVSCENDVDAPFETVIPERAITAPIKSATATVGDFTAEGVINDSDSIRTITFVFTREDVDLSAVNIHLEIISRATASTGCFTDTTLNLAGGKTYSFAVFNREKDLTYTIKAKLPSFVEIDRTQCSVFYNRTGDAAIALDNGYGVTFNGDELFDGKWMSGYQRYSEVAYHYFGSKSASPSENWFTFDVGESVRMYKIVLMPYNGYTNYDPAQYEIWAYNSTADLGESTPADWQTNGKWVKIVDEDISSLYTVAKALAKDDVGDATKDPCVDGAESVVSDYTTDVPYARYYRFVCKSSYYGVYKEELTQWWSGRVKGFMMSELRLWKYREEQ